MALAQIIFTKNPLALSAFERHALEPGARPIDWLLEHYPPPYGAGGRVHHWHNGELVDCAADDYLERPVLEGDCVILAVHPAEPLSISFTTILVIAAVTAVISAAVSIGLALLFPDAKAPQDAVAGESNAASPTYDVRSRQNSARLGQPIPVVYGSVLMTPDLCAQPYHIFDPPRGMHLDQLMCLGHGHFDVQEVLVGETESSSIEGAAVQYIIVPPEAHGGVFGNLTAISLANGWGEPFFENMWSSLEVAEQRFTNAGDSSGFFRIGRAGVQTGQNIFILIEFPRGLYQMPDWGNPTGTQCNIDVTIVQADAEGNPIGGTDQVHHFVAEQGSLDPYRITYVIDTGYPAAWLVKVDRPTAQFPNGNEMNEYFWRGLSLQAGHDGQTLAYGNVTLMMVRLKAEEVATGAQRLIRVRLVRRLPSLGAGPESATANPSDAFCDIYCNQVYGARRPTAELELETIVNSRIYWGENDYQFNAVYSARTTVWEALAQSVQGVAAVPLPIGGAMGLAQDGPRPARSMMFTEQNIVQRTFTLSYQFEQTGQADGIEIEYVDPDTWAPAYVRWPVDSLAPERMNLFGCSDTVQAQQFARLQWQRRQKLRRLVEFSTELEGLIPRPGERIAVAHTLPRWGVSGYVARAEPNGLELELDRTLPWDEFAGPYYMMFRDELSGASDVVQVAQGFSGANWIVLGANPWPGPPENYWRVGLRQEGTHFTWGTGDRVVKDFTLTAITPKGAAVVGLSGVVYDPSVYDGTLYFLANPVP